LLVLGALAIPACRPTRLETRTKESNIGASPRVANPRGEVKASGLVPQGGKLGGSPPWPHRPPASILTVKGLSESVAVRTRKMVIFAWLG